jgi:hypothetical protein
MALKRRGTQAASGSRRGETLGKLGEEAATKKRGKEWMSIGDGETAVMRVLPDTFEEIYAHRHRDRGQGQPQEEGHHQAL